MQKANLLLSCAAFCGGAAAGGAVGAHHVLRESFFSPLLEAFSYHIRNNSARTNKREALIRVEGEFAYNGVGGRGGGTRTA